MERKFERNDFGKRLKSMLKVDFRRMFTMPLLYIVVGVCLVIPILILVMTTMMDGTVSVNPQTGVETVIEGFDNVWQTIGSVSGAAMSMDLTGMCNINMLYFFIAVLVGLFVAEDFRSGYSKNLFTVRAKKTDYVISKTLVGFVGGALMLLAFFIGAMLGGAIAGVSFELGEVGVAQIAACMLSKLCLVAVFVPIYLAVSVAAKQKAWLSIVGSLCVGMLLFTMIPMLTPLDSGIMNVVLCLAGGAMFSVGLGAVSDLILRKTSLV
ncbi:MAG: ABC transporter permease [Clostridia bacterium]|nr:ABC transporter permease [Clostridia bacterium]